MGKKAKELNLQELFYAMINRIWLIALSAFILGVLVYIYSSNFITPRYKSSVTLYVNNTNVSVEAEEISSSDLATSQRLVDTYVAILEQYDTMKEVAAQVKLDTGKDVTPSMISGNMSAAAINETEVFVITVSHTDPDMSKYIAKAIGDVAPGVINRIVNGSSAVVVNTAQKGVRYTPNNTKNAIYGAIAGALLAIAYVVIWVLTDVRINGEEDLAVISSAPVLGLIPNFDSDEKSGYSYQKHDYTTKVSKEVSQ